jgi:hypothetical protein
VSDDVISRIFGKLDLANERLARVETMLEEREKRADRERERQQDIECRLLVLEKTRSGFAGAKSIVAWLVTTAIAVYGTFRN